MKPTIIIGLMLFLAGCNTVDGVNAALSGVQTLDRWGVNYDTNGYYSKRKGPVQKLCVRHNGNIETWYPCLK